ncbi:MAG: polysaccharide biosynthesis tyrosine autokinase [Proteobacteria bacterium]|nr:polysaccharide biosynthesis tyrosine autokinase [Pseudomonadota bacterium]MCP4915480.1 polysaccharide biosynthesis tyrosine autokinase [Pseudomonadota bacterium]
MELLRIWTALLRRRWLLGQAVVFFTLVGLVSALLLPKSYQATSKVMISSSDATSAVLSDLGLQELAVGLSGESDDIQNHIALATTRPIVEDLVWKLQLRDDDGVLVEPDKLIIPGTFAALSADPLLEIKQHQSTDIIIITATSNDPELSRLMADTLARVYIADTLDRSRQETREAHRFVEGRLEVVQAEFDRALTRIADVQESEQIIDLDSEVRASVSRLSEMMLMGEETTTRAAEVRAQISALRGVQGREDIDYIGPATVSENSDIRTLRDQLLTLRTQRVTETLEKTARHPDVLRIDAQIANAEEEMMRTLEEQHGMDPTVVQLEVELAGLLDRSAAIDAAINRTTERFSLYPDKMRRLSQLELAATAAEEVYRSLQAQSYQIAVAEAMSTSPIQFVEPAQRPDRQVSPRILVNLVIGFGVGCLVGFGLVAVFEYVDDSIKTPDELKEAWDAPQLGVVPRFAAGVGVTIAGLKPTDPVVEGFRTLRSAIEYATLDKPASSMMVTSSLPGEGKSTVLASLAVAMANEGKRVLLLDCDLRRPMQHTFHPQNGNATGVTEVLLGRTTWQEAVQSTPVEGLSLLSSGPIPPNPGKLVESLKLRQLLNELVREHDVVLVDAPPALVVNDALLIAGMVDHVVCVVEANATARRVLQDARDRLEGHGVEPLGLVLNKLDYDTAGYGVYARAYETYSKGGAA